MNKKDKDCDFGEILYTETTEKGKMILRNKFGIPYNPSLFLRSEMFAIIVILSLKNFLSRCWSVLEAIAQRFF